MQETEKTFVKESTQDTIEFNVNRARRLLYISHAFAEFSECAWQFALILFLAAFSDYKSLLLVSSYGLTTGLVVCLWGTAAGRFVDSYDRIVVARVFILSENICVILAATLCYYLLSSTLPQQLDDSVENDSSWWESHLAGLPRDSKSRILLLGIHIFGPIASILDSGFSVAIERDWIVVMSENAPGTNYGPTPYGSIANGEIDARHTWLSETNVAMKQIDLTCKVMAPAVAGFVISAFDKAGPRSSGTNNQGYTSDLTGAAVVVTLVTICSLWIEYVCTERIFKMVPALSSPKVQSNRGRRDAECASPLSVPKGLQLYFEQPISFGGLGLALLYLNALTFGALMTAYLVWRGMRLETVGIWRGISSAIGLAGTYVYHFSVQRTTLVSTGMWSVAFEMICLSLSFLSLFVENYELSMFMLIAGVCASRIGLWVFDIAVTQLQQEFVPRDIRGSVGGTQESLNALFQLLSFGIGLIFPDPREFHVFVSSGYVAVWIAVLLFYFCIYRREDEFRIPSENPESHTHACREEKQETKIERSA